MSRVERAVILAAGKGTRLAPITDLIPKPLISVNGKRMIESIIEALLVNSIKEIYIVIGYKKDSFLFLREKYPSIQFIFNPYFETCNNISSLYVARKYIDNALVIEGDLNIRDACVFSPEFSRSGYNAVKIDNYTNEWVLQINDLGVVTSCNRKGGSKGWQLYGISRWTECDAEKLRHNVEEEFINKKNIDIYWDEIALFLHKAEYELGIFKMELESVLEIDSIEELAKVDKKYDKIVRI